MIKLEGKGPVKEMELFFDVLCSYGLVKTCSQTYVNIEGDRSLIVAEVGVPRCIYEADDLRPADDENQRFITEDQIPDRYLPDTILYRCAHENVAEADK